MQGFKTTTPSLKRLISVRRNKLTPRDCKAYPNSTKPSLFDRQLFVQGFLVTHVFTFLKRFCQRLRQRTAKGAGKIWFAQKSFA